MINTNGSIAIEGHDKVETVVDVTAHASDEKDLEKVMKQVEMGVHASGFLLKYTDPKDCFNCWADFKVKVHHDAEIETYNENGYSEVNNMKNIQNLQSYNGSIKTGKPHDKIFTKTYNGKSIIIEPQKEVVAHSYNGKIDVLNPQEQVIAESYNGTINIENAMNSVDSKTYNGTINISQHSSAIGKIKAITSNGTIRIRNLMTALYARAQNSDIFINKGNKNATVDADSILGKVRFF